MLLRVRQDGEDDGEDENDDRERNQPLAHNLVNRQREEIKAELLMKDRVGRRNRRLIQIKRQLTPAVFHPRSEKEAENN